MYDLHVCDENYTMRQKLEKVPRKIGCLIWINSKQLHLVAGEDNEPKNTELAWKNRNGAERQQVQRSQGEKMKRTKRNGERRERK